MLSLKAAEGGGICGDDDAGVKILEAWKGRGTDGCLSFGREGKRLVAVDVKGSGVVVEFEKG